jgi:hypothetical protein
MDIKEEVAKNVSGAGDTVQKIVIDLLSELEIDRRAKLILEAHNKLTVLEKEIKKLDVLDCKNYIGDPLIEQRSMSAARFESLTKAKEAFTKLKTAADNALKDNSTETYQKLSEIIAKVNNVGKDSKAGTSEGGSAS